MGTVVEAMEKRGEFVTLMRDGRGWFARFEAAAGAEADTAPMAVALAALRAVDEEA